MYPKGCKIGASAEMTAIKDSSSSKYLYTSSVDNYGYINQVWKAGSYEVITKATW
jgi:hypothetical protein